MTRTRISFFALLVLFFSAYIFFQARNFISGPKILIFEPSSGAVFRDSYIVVKGKAENISFLSFNGRQIFADEKGDFQEDLILVSGYNIIELAGRDKFNRQIAKKIEVILKDN